MGKPEPYTRALPRLVAAVLALVLCACAARPPAAVDAARPPLPATASEPATRSEEPRADSLSTLVVPVPVPLPEPTATTRGIAVVLSGSEPAYTSVATELSRLLGDASFYQLGAGPDEPAAVFRRIGDSDSGTVVAIGAAAARAAVTLASVPVIFCQVFNYRDAGLVTETSRGVAVLAPLDAHLDAWQDSTPSLRRIGVILGAGHEALVEEAEVAAARHGLELSVRLVSSDQEAQYQFRRLVNEIDGFWLFPDNRVLSERTLNEMLTLARRRDIEVAVSNEALLDAGATISLSAVPADVATTIVGMLRRIDAGELAELPEITPLSAVQVVTR